jgi:hypothetical protein
LPSQAPKSQPELLGNHQQNRQLAAADQAVQADLVADARKDDPADPAADLAPAKSGPIQTNRIFN